MSEMADQPFFSIIIPTKGRPNLLVDAIGSVLHQDFYDYELIVSDNFNDERTKQSVDLYKGHSCIRYFRTESELNMPQHWEFATTKAKGKFVLVLTDRSVLKQHALATIHKELVARPEVAICSWRWTLFDEHNGVEFGATADLRMQEIELFTASFLAVEFVRKAVHCLYSLPRGLNSCYRADLAKQIREKHGALFLPISPDFSSAFLLLAYTKNILHINKALFLSQGLADSNGGRNTASTDSKYLESLNLPSPYQYVPIRAPIVENLIFSDFVMAKKITDGNLATIEIDWVVYFVECYREILAKTDASLLNKADIKQMASLWGKALATFDTNIQFAVRVRLWPIKLHKFVLAYLRRSFIGPTLIAIKRSFTALGDPGSRAKYRTVMAAAGHYNSVKKS